MWRDSSSASTVFRSGARIRKTAWIALAAAPVAVALSSRVAAAAATETWTGATDTEWLTPGNWTGGNAPQGC